MSKQTRLNVTAERIGSTLGHLQARYDAWMKERSLLASELSNYISLAQQLRTTLGHTADVVVAEAKVAVAAGDLARKRVISEAHKQAISAAAKARWAARKGGAVAVVTEKPTRNVSPEVRARLSKLAKARWAKAKKAGKMSLG